MISRCGASVIVVCAIMVVLVSANSGGLNIPCNVHPSQVPQGAFGTTNRQKAYLAGRAQTEENVVPMWWTLIPDWSDANAQRNAYTNTPKYTVRTADGPVGQDPTSYVPGQFIDIIVRTLEKDQQFAGLLMYAQKGSGETGERVGEWLLPPRQNFQIDPSTGCVTHKNADPKNYKSVFRVRFPPGTGTVTIKALVKVGLAFPENAGAFFWPNTRQQGFLTLTEQTNNIPTVSWFQGNLGQSCNQVCAATGGQCDAATMSSVGTNPAQLMAAVSRNSACFGPIMRGCGSFAPTVGTEGCFYSDTTCTRDPIRAADPCAGYPTWTLTTPKKAYHQLGNNNQPPLPSCVSYNGFLWCAKGYTDNEPNTNNNWNRITACGSDAALTLSYPAMTRAAEPVDCTSVRTTAQDGQRLCACTGSSQTGGGTLPTPGIPQNLPTSATPVTTQAPPATTTAPVVTTRPPTSVPTMATSDSLMLSSSPSMINPTGSFVVRFTYSALGARTIVADVLSASFEWFGGGYVNVAAGSSGMVNVNITMNGRAIVGRNYMINYYLVDQQIFNNGQNPQAWQQAIQTMSSGIMITMDPIPTDLPTEEPTELPSDTTRRPTKKPTISGAATNSTPIMLLISLMALACGSFHSLSSRSMMVLCVIGMVLLSTGLPGADAHNWLTSPSRSNRGIGPGGDFNGWTSPPCPARSSRIHAQVGTGQRFPVEWASGHGYGSSTYLVIVKTADEGRLRELDERLMDTYLREAPAEPYMADTKAWHVFSDGPGQKLGSLDQKIATNRPANFKPFNAQAGTWSKTAAATQNDKRASYVNPKWPWIVSVHKFAMHEDRPEDADGALVEIPNGQPAGSYIVHYFWRGYYDCMDVNVLGGSTLRTTDVFGSAVVPAVYGVDRTLHTTYPSNRPNYNVIGECRVMNEFEVIGPGNECFNECTQGYNQQNANSACQAIITVPIELPALGPFPAGRTHLPQKCLQQQRVVSALNPSKTFVCYLVNGGTPPQVGPATKTVYDPEDPVFYHTAHLIRSPWKFADTCTSCQAPPPPVDWRYADKCISCADTAKNVLGKGQPLWNFIDNCQHCDARLA